jgi:hypothetical protein
MMDRHRQPAADLSGKGHLSRCCGPDRGTRIRSHVYPPMSSIRALGSKRSEHRTDNGRLQRADKRQGKDEEDRRHRYRSRRTVSRQPVRWKS